MPIESDADRLAMLAVFGEAVTVASVSITALFDNEYARVGGFVESSNPTLTCRSTDVASVVRGAQVVRAGVTYTVRSIEPDGTGITVLQLERS